MKVYSAEIERCPQTGLFVGFVPGFSGAHSQGETLDELNRNLSEIIAMLLEDGEPELESEFVGIQNVSVAARAASPFSSHKRSLQFSASLGSLR
jgi:predicted RNase H-like HicB family nuclease